MTPFMVWLIAQVKRNDFVGDLARDAKQDLQDKYAVDNTWVNGEWRLIKGKHWCGTEWHFSSHKLCKHLFDTYACSGAVRAAIQARREFFHGQGVVYNAVPEHPGVYCISYGCQPDLVKIGRAENIKKRLSSLETGAPGGIQIRKIFSANPDDEKLYHKKYAEYLANGEWFFVKGQLAKDLSCP